MQFLIYAFPLMSEIQAQIQAKSHRKSCCVVLRVIFIMKAPKGIIKAADSDACVLHFILVTHKHSCVFNNTLK